MRVEPHDARLLQSPKRSKARVAIPREHDDGSILRGNCQCELGIYVSDGGELVGLAVGALDDDAPLPERIKNRQRAAANFDRAAAEVIGNRDHRQAFLSIRMKSPAIARHEAAPLKPTSGSDCPR